MVVSTVMIPLPMHGLEMLDKVDRSPMRVGNTYEEFWMVVPYDHL